LLNINKLPAVTIYTCNYNTRDYILDCMNSVFRQTYQDFEYIVIDDHSDDDSMNLITEYTSLLSEYDRKRVRVIRNSKNIGLPASCNKILELSRGKYIIRVDSDDVLEPHCIEKMVESMRLNDAQGVLSGYRQTEEFLTVTSDVVENKWHPGCALLSKWAVNEIKYQDGLKFEEGKEFYNRFKQRYKINFIEEPLWKYRSRPDSKTKDPEHPDNEFDEVIEKIKADERFVK